MRRDAGAVHRGGGRRVWERVTSPTNSRPRVLRGTSRVSTKLGQPKCAPSGKSGSTGLLTYIMPERPVHTCSRGAAYSSTSHRRSRETEGPCRHATSVAKCARKWDDRHAFAWHADLQVVPRIEAMQMEGTKPSPAFYGL